MVSRHTPDQKVACSNHVNIKCVVNIARLEVIYVLLFFNSSCSILTN
jgi:hypothetical protein